MSGFEHFDFISPIYDLIFGRRIDREIVTFIEPDPDDILLDVGGGTGRVSVLFESLTDHVYILDSSINMLRQAFKKGLAGLAGESETLPFHDESFDKVIIVDAFHHVRHHQATLDELWRVLKKGGRLIIEEPDIKNWLVKGIALGEKLLLMRSHFHSPEQILTMCDYDDIQSQSIERKDGIAWIILTKVDS
jgi:demethylmenaquinone methyltransferase/2-methoxy-6-polyprenyl-1,4-benzoquinol methylase